MTFRPDLVGCWVFRVTPERGLEILLIRRASGRIYPGVWQCVTGGLEGDEKVVDGALRELVEETGYTAADLEALYGLDQVNLFHADHVDALMAEAVFAARVRPGLDPRLSHEHDAFRWLSPDSARETVVWPAYRSAIEQLEWLVSHPQHAPWLLAGPWAPAAAKLPGT
jgi:dihydroneopterin triphosphate diphosphatase